MELTPGVSLSGACADGFEAMEYLKDNEVDLIKESLTDNFLQIHRSYIVNMDHVQLVERSRIVMDEENRLPEGESFKPVFQ